MTDKHLSTQFDAELSGISTRVLEMGGLVESQVAQAVYALSNFSAETATQVLAQEAVVNQMEVDIDRDLSTIIARRPHRSPRRPAGSEPSPNMTKAPTVYGMRSCQAMPHSAAMAPTAVAKMSRNR